MDEFLIWNVSPEIYSLGILKIRWYSLMFIIGFISSYYIVRKIYRDEGYSEAQVSNLLTYVILGTIIGARLGHCFLYQPGFYFSNPLEIFKIWKGGLASHGGFTGVILAVLLYCRRYNIGFIWLIDRVSASALLIASLIRVGNFFNSEILGIPSQLPWAIIFSRVDMIPRHPAQLYEALCYFCIFLFLSFLFWRTDSKNHPGRIWGTALAISFSVRFLLEFLKENQVDFEQELILNMGQILSVPFISLGLFLIFRNSSKASGSSQA